ncbi:hypothetical protein FRB93_002983 [Tulasnella sp. JGI-2019a]|nr:hypothetical protein FRB93_002983 [Tulasnella sp. JGI-2019a]
MNAARCNRQFQEEAERIIYNAVALNSLESLANLLIGLRALDRGEIRCGHVRSLHLTIQLSNESMVQLHQLLSLIPSLLSLEIYGDLDTSTLFYLMPGDRNSSYSFCLRRLELSRLPVDLVVFLASQPSISELFLAPPSGVHPCWAFTDDIIPDLRFAGLPRKLATALVPGRPVQSLCTTYQDRAAADLARVLEASAVPVRDLFMVFDTLTVGGLATMSCSLHELECLKLLQGGIRDSSWVEVDPFGWLPGLIKYRKLTKLVLHPRDLLSTEGLQRFLNSLHTYCPSLETLDVQPDNGSASIHLYEKSRHIWVVSS